MERVVSKGSFGSCILKVVVSLIGCLTNFGLAMAEPTLQWAPQSATVSLPPGGIQDVTGVGGRLGSRLEF
jgi:hypothetical protein